MRITYEIIKNRGEEFLKILEISKDYNEDISNFINKFLYKYTNKFEKVEYFYPRKVYQTVLKLLFHNYFLPKKDIILFLTEIWKNSRCLSNEDKTFINQLQKNIIDYNDFSSLKNYMFIRNKVDEQRLKSYNNKYIKNDDTFISDEQKILNKAIHFYDTGVKFIIDYLFIDENYLKKYEIYNLIDFIDKDYSKEMYEEHFKDRDFMIIYPYCSIEMLIIHSCYYFIYEKVKDLKMSLEKEIFHEKIISLYREIIKDLLNVFNNPNGEWFKKSGEGNENKL